LPAGCLLCSTSHAFDHRVVLVDGDLLSLTEVRNLYVFQLHVEAVADDPATGEKGNVLQYALALIPEARCPYCSNLQGAPRSLFTTSVASASPSTSSAIMSSGLPLLVICSSSGSKSFLELIVFS